MKKAILQPFYVIAFIGCLGITIASIPFIFRLLSGVSYKFVILFLVLIFASNVLARLAKAYINL